MHMEQIRAYRETAPPLLCVVCVDMECVNGMY